MPEGFATRADLSRVEQKVDSMGTNLFNVSSDVRSIRDQLEAREKMEKQAQILMSEVAAEKAKAATAKQENIDAWNSLKSRALWTAMLLLTVASYPGLVNMVKQVKGVIP